MRKMYVGLHLVCYYNKVWLSQIYTKQVLCAMLLCFVTLIDVNKHIYELLLNYLYVNTNLCFTVSILWHNLVPCLQ